MHTYKHVYMHTYKHKEGSDMNWFDWIINGLSERFPNLKTIWIESPEATFFPVSKLSLIT